jgi:methionyl-tRNA formyltransferase
MKNVLVLTDNIIIFEKFKKICLMKNKGDIEFSYHCSPSSIEMFEGYSDVSSLDVKAEYKKLIGRFDLIISCHCKKIFPAGLVNNVRCINIHPGLNPYNRGWYPQVFAINNGLPHGATIHVMDEYIDHGEIIAQEQVSIESYDTSLSAYEKVLNTEIALFDEYYDRIIDGTYTSLKMVSEGNYNSISDFKKLCHLDLNKIGSLKEHINLLRSLTHGKYKNAYFYDDSGEKVYIAVEFDK